MNDKNIAIPVNNISLSRRPDIVNTIVKVLEAYTLWERVPARQSEFLALRDNINKVTGLNIATIAGLEAYLKNFISNFNTNGMDLRDFPGLKDIKSDKYLVSFNKGSIHFGKGKLASKVKFINQGNKVEEAVKLIEDFKAHITNMYANIGLRNLS